MKLIRIITLSLILSAIYIITSSMLTIQGHAQDIRLIVDGKDITELSTPIIQNGRTMVPIRFVTEEIGATVNWDPNNRTVEVIKGNQSVFLKIGSALVGYNQGASYQVSDVTPLILGGRTYVPLRLISNAFGIGIEWVNETREVLVDSNKTSVKAPFHEVVISSLSPGQTIQGKTAVTFTFGDRYKTSLAETRLLLVDRQTATGFVVGRSLGDSNSLIYVPSLEENGNKVMVVALYDKNNKLIAADAVPVVISVTPNIVLEGLTHDEVIQKTVVLKPNVNFIAEHLTYELTNLSTGKVITVIEQDPFGSYTWTPTKSQEGNYSVKVMAYDATGKVYHSAPYTFSVQVEASLSLTGVTTGMTVNKPVTLLASRNFDVRETTYLIKDEKTGVETVLATLPYGGYRWFPDQSFSGNKALKVRVIDAGGTTRESAYIQVKVDGSPRLQLSGVGPNQVLTGETKLNVNSNVTMDKVNYILINKSTGSTKIVGQDIPADSEWIFKPTASDGGQVSLKAEGYYNGTKIISETIDFRIYLDKTFGPKAIIEKDKFLAFSSGMAKTSWNSTGMSAALQTAQAILETGWGQSVPRDKYSGKFSYNLFGIKGSATNGSVTSNTWEVYNGVTYRVDANFRAYNNAQESWNDHKSLLFNADRYAPFRDVMYHSSLGAWAIKRAGYATDPQYPIKLMKLIRQYNLKELDRVGI
ncbi:stalk domain-containing protein [Petrocella sp. FN5]|uniref:stalk domain-containing protein n=1 Tax=Petrocella sp. FN5 TaxID=3032002 RepID=UPI0023DBD15A|nr:glucosaminidase domain-containing protein [Petrocella sp. FN5]MDF1615851.1 stalk domain-containing protein [Petrocella sp. FN5]